MGNGEDIKDMSMGTKANNKLGVTPVLILCDNSGSMKDYVATVNECTRKLIQDLKNNLILANQIELSVASFNATYQEILPFTRVRNIKLDQVKKIEPEEWVTYLGSALSKAVSALAEEKALLKKSRTKYNQPILIVLSDGYPYKEKEEQIAAGIKAVQDKIRLERWSCIPILIGYDYGGKLTIMSDIAVPDKNGKRDYIRFDSKDKKIDIFDGFKFASMSIEAVGQNANGPMAQPMSTKDLKDKIYRNKKKRESFVDHMN